MVHSDASVSVPFEGEWSDIATAPKDGSLIRLTWMIEDEPQDEFVMRWGHIQRNGLFPGRVGMWVSPCGSFTWNEDGMGGGPQFWQPLKEPTNG